MAQLTLYADTKLLYEKNFILEPLDLEEYLAPLTWATLDNINYFKNSLNGSIKLDLSQYYLSLVGREDANINYMKIVNESGDIVYYHILSFKWKSTSTLELELIMDVLNTYVATGLLQLNDKTKVIRQHKDRFIKAVYDVSEPRKLTRKIDTVSEGFAPLKIKDANSFKTILDNKLNEAIDFYLMYRTRETLSPTDLSNPVNCYLIPSKDLPTRNTGADFIEYGPNDLQSGGFYFTLQEEGNEGLISLHTSNGVVSHKFGDTSVIGVNPAPFKALEFWKANNKIVANIKVFNANGVEAGNQSFEVSKIVFNKNFNTIYYNEEERPTGVDINFQTYQYWALTKRKIFIGANDAQVIHSIDAVDRLDSRIMKIIKLPYAPLPITKESNNLYSYDTTKWEMSDGFLRLKNLNTEFNNEIASINLPNLIYNAPSNLDITRNAIAESKLFNSEFYTFKIGYDSFTKSIDYERLNLQYSNNADKCKISYKMTNTINSKMLFKIDIDGYKEIEDYEKYLNVTRNNEVAIFSNDYINYIRSGYNYDKKTLERQNATRWLSTAVGVAGGVVGGLVGGTFGAAVGVSLGASAVNSLISNATSQIQNEQNLEAKLKQLSLQSTAVASSDDVDLMSYYSGNKAFSVEYKPTPIMQRTLFDLFYYCGYTVNYNEPINTNSRKSFNFLQCEPVFDRLASVDYEVVNNAIERYKNGVTYMHKWNNYIDFDQDKENWETWIQD